MKTMLMTLVLITSMEIHASLVLSAFQMDVYRFGVSKNEDCSDMKVVIDNNLIPLRVDLANNPNFGSAYIEPGTYKCVALEVGRRIYITPAVTPAGVGTCAAGVQASTFMGVNISDAALVTYDNSMNAHDRRVFHNTYDSILLDKTSIDFVEDILLPNSSKLTFYLTNRTVNVPAGDDTCYLLSPFLTNAWCGIKIAQPLVVTANTAGKFITRVVNPATAIDNSTAGECNISDIEFDFQ